jgi:hypothetical protein
MFSPFPPLAIVIKARVLVRVNAAAVAQPAAQLPSILGHFARALKVTIFPQGSDKRNFKTDISSSNILQKRASICR